MEKISSEKTKTFFSYVIPSVLAFALSGVYTIVDGLFIGRSLGAIGLAAIALGFPIAAFIQAVGTGIGLAAPTAQRPADCGIFLLCRTAPAPAGCKGRGSCNGNGICMGHFLHVEKAQDFQSTQLPVTSFI